MLFRVLRCRAPSTADARRLPYERLGSESEETNLQELPALLTAAVARTIASSGGSFRAVLKIVKFDIIVIRSKMKVELAFSRREDIQDGAVVGSVIRHQVTEKSGRGGV